MPRKNLEETHQRADDLYVVNKIVREVDSVFLLKYVAWGHDYSKTTGTVEPPHYKTDYFSDNGRCLFDKHPRQKTASKAS